MIAGNKWHSSDTLSSHLHSSCQGASPKAFEGKQASKERLYSSAEGNPELLGHHQFYPQWIPGSQVSIVFRCSQVWCFNFSRSLWGDGASKPAIPLFERVPGTLGMFLNNPSARHKCVGVFAVHLARTSQIKSIGGANIPKNANGLGWQKAWWPPQPLQSGWQVGANK